MKKNNIDNSIVYKLIWFTIGVMLFSGICTHAYISEYIDNSVNDYAVIKVEPNTDTIKNRE